MLCYVNKNICIVHSGQLLNQIWGMGSHIADGQRGKGRFSWRLKVAGIQSVGLQIMAGNLTVRSQCMAV